MTRKYRLMPKISELNFDSKNAMQGILTLCEKLCLDFSAQEVKHLLNDLTNKARSIMPKAASTQTKIACLMRWFFKEMGFKCASGVYDLSSNLWPDEVLKNRQGVSLSLGLIIIDIAKRLKVPLSAVIFPSQLVIRADISSNHYLFFDPTNGNILDKRTLSIWAKEDMGEYVLRDHRLEAAQSFHIICEYLALLKIAFIEENKVDMALSISEALLKVFPNDPYEIRDRGIIYAFLDCHQAALSDLKYFVENCPQDPLSEVLKSHIDLMRVRPVTLH